MNYIITGGLGYIGSTLARHLLKKGCHVTIIDNCRTHDIKTYEKARTKLERYPNCLVDIVDLDVLRPDMLKGADAIFHLAAISGIKACENNIHEAKLVNRQATKRVMQRAMEAHVPRVIFTSTAAVYGQHRRCTEQVDPDPKNVYAKTKMEAERIVLQEPQVRGIVVRLSNVYGMSYYDKPTVLSEFARKALEGRAPIIYGSGGQTRDFIHVDDVARALIFLAEHSEAEGIYNVGSGKTTKIMTVAKLTLRLAGNKRLEPIHEPDIRAEPEEGYKYVIDKIKGLGWKPRMTLKHGIKLLMEGIKEC